MVEQKFGMYGYLDIHKATRRHLDNYLLKASLVSANDLKTIKTLQSDFDFYWNMLEHHHKTEDAGFFPMLGGIDSTFATQIAAMTEDHEVVDEMVVKIKAYLVDAANGKANAYDQFLEQTRAFRDTLFDHLDREEEIVIPAVNRHFTYEQQLVMEEQVISAMPVEHVAIMFPWIYEVMTTVERVTAYGQLPESFRASYGYWEEEYYLLRSAR